MRHRRWLAASAAAALTLAAALACTAAQAMQASQAQADANASTRRQNAQTEQANRDAAVPDEAHAPGTGARPARTRDAGAGTSAQTGAAGTGTTGTARAPLPPSYGPQLYLNGKPVTDPARRDPAEVHDETDTGANPAAHPSGSPALQPAHQPTAQQLQRLRQQAARRHPAWQAAADPLAPRPLREGAANAANAANPEPVPPPAAMPQPVVPSTSVVRGCVGAYCTDTSGKSFNGAGAAGVDSNGRLCTRSGVTVQCF